MTRFTRPTPPVRRRPAALLAAALGVGLMAAPAPAQQQQPSESGPSGEAVVRQRTGPEVQVRQGQSPRVLALFTTPGSTAAAQNRGQQPQAGGNVEIVLLERPTPQQGQDGQPQAQQALNQPGKEVVFPAANAREGVVSYSIDGGSPRTFTVLARKPGEALQVREVTRSPDVVVLKVVPSQEKLQQMQQEMQQRQQEQMQQAQARAEQAGNQAAQQVAAAPADGGDAQANAQGAQDGQQTPADGQSQANAQANAQANPQADGAQPASGQQPPQRTPQQEQAYQQAYQQAMQQARQDLSAQQQQQQEPAYAVVMMYLGDGAE